MHANPKSIPSPHAGGPVRDGLRKSLERVRERCTNCGACSETCAFLKRYGTPGEIALAYDPSDAKCMAMPFACSLCRLCSALCPVDAAPAGMFLEMRREAYERGNGTLPEHKGLTSFERTGMSRRFTWYGLPEGCTAVFFPGCALPGTRPGTTEKIFKMLREDDPCLGIVLDCCGRISEGLGRQAFANAMMDEMKSYLTAHGVSEVIVACPNCYYMFKEYAPGLRVRTVYEALQGKKHVPGAEKTEVVLHDPCATRFHTGCHDAVREVLGTVRVKVSDMDHTRELTLCCGNGAGVEAVSPDLAERWTRSCVERIQGRTMATYCAGCAQKLGSQAKTIHVLDILCDPDVALAGSAPVAKAPMTYLNRIRLKGRFQKSVSALHTRERTFRAAEKPKGALGRVLVLAGIIAAIIAARATGLTDSLDQERLRVFIQSTGLMAPLIYMGFYAIAPSLLLPGLPITIAGGILFGPFWGVVYTITGATAGAYIAFLVARYAARGWVESRLTSPRWKRLDEGVERHGWKVVAFTRLIPLFPFNLLNYAFGLTRIGFIPYACATFFCMLPACIAFIVFSSSLMDLLKGNVSANLLIGAGLVAVVLFIPAAYRMYRKRYQDADPL